MKIFRKEEPETEANRPVRKNPESGSSPDSAPPILEKNKENPYLAQQLKETRWRHILEEQLADLPEKMPDGSTKEDYIQAIVSDIWTNPDWQKEAFSAEKGSEVDAVGERLAAQLKEELEAVLEEADTVKTEQDLQKARKTAVQEAKSASIAIADGGHVAEQAAGISREQGETSETTSLGAEREQTQLTKLTVERYRKDLENGTSLDVLLERLEDEYDAAEEAIEDARIDGQDSLERENTMKLEALNEARKMLQEAVMKESA